MLPDFPRLKTKLARFLVARMKSVHDSHAVPFGRMPHFQIQEGNCVTMVRADGSVEEIEMEHYHAEVRISNEELETLSPEEFTASLMTLPEKWHAKRARLSSKQLRREWRRLGTFFIIQVVQQLTTCFGSTTESGSILTTTAGPTFPQSFVART